MSLTVTAKTGPMLEMYSLYSVNVSNLVLKFNHLELSFRWMIRCYRRSHTFLPGFHHFPSQTLLPYIPHPTQWVPNWRLPSLVAMMETRWKGAMAKIQALTLSKARTALNTWNDDAFLALEQDPILALFQAWNRQPTLRQVFCNYATISWTPNGFNTAITGKDSKTPDILQLTILTWVGSQYVQPRRGGRRRK